MELTSLNGWGARTRTQFRHDTPGPKLSQSKASPILTTQAAVLLACLAAATYSASPRRAWAAPPLTAVHAERNSASVVEVRGNDVDSALTALDLTVTGLADLMGVSRPSIYTWRRGGSITAENAARLGSLVEAGLMLRKAKGEKLPADWSTRPIDADGMTFRSGFASGQSPVDLASRLIKQWQLGATKRDELDSLLRGLNTASSGDSDFSPPDLGEHVSGGQ